MTNATGSKIAADQAPKKPAKVWGRPFAKGVSGNPGGRKKVPVNVGELVRQATPEAVVTLISIMKDKKASFAVRAYCAEKIIERAYGKPTQQTTLLAGSFRRRASDLTDDELATIIAGGKLAPREPPMIEHQPIEHQPIDDQSTQPAAPAMAMELSSQLNTELSADEV